MSKTNPLHRTDTKQEHFNSNSTRQIKNLRQMQRLKKYAGARSTYDMDNAGKHLLMAVDASVDYGYQHTWESQ